MKNPKLSEVVSELHAARDALKVKGIAARFDLEITDQGPRAYANVTPSLLKIAQEALPSNLQFATVRAK